MIPCEVLEILVQDLAARPDHEGRPKLHRASAQIVLALTFQRGAGAGHHLPRPHQRTHREGVGADDASCLAVFIEEDFEGNRLVLDERHGVAATTRSDGRHVGTGVENLLVSLADLTGPFPASESAEVTEEEDDPGVLLPAITQTMLISLRVDQYLVGQGRDIKRHQQILEPYEGWPNSET